MTFESYVARWTMELIAAVWLFNAIVICWVIDWDNEGGNGK